MAREVSESCLDILLIEIVSAYTNDLYADKPELVAQAIEAMGYQVGNQLCERFVSHISPYITYFKNALWSVVLASENYALGIVQCRS